MAVWSPETDPRKPGIRVQRVAVHAEARLARAQLALLVGSTCAALRVDWQGEAGRLRRPDCAAFEARVLRQAGRAAGEVAAAAAARFGDVARRAGLDAPATAGAAAPRFRPPAPGRSALEDALSAVIGAGFGLGVSLTAGRVLAELGATPAMLTGCGGIGVSLTWWVVRARRLLCARAALGRWAAEVAAALRAALQDQVLSAESELLSRTPDYRRM